MQCSHGKLQIPAELPRFWRQWQQGGIECGQDWFVLKTYIFFRMIRYKTTPNTQIDLNQSELHLVSYLQQPSPKMPKQKLQLREVEDGAAGSQQQRMRE